MKNDKTVKKQKVIAIMIIGILLTGVMGCSARKKENQTSIQPTSNEKTDTINNQIQPSEDFYQSVIYNLIEEKRELGYTQWSWQMELEENTFLKIQDIINELKEKEESLDKGSIEKNVLDFYQCAQNSSQDQRKQWSLLEVVMKDIRNATTVQEYMNAVADYIHKYGVDNLFSLTIAPDQKDSKIYSAYLGLPAFSMDQEKYINIEETSDYEQYVSSAKSFFMLLGKTEKEAEYIGKQIIEFEKKFALMMATGETEDKEEDNATYTSDELAKVLTNVNINDLLKHMGLDEEQQFYINGPRKWLEVMDEYLNEESLELLKGYSMYSIYQKLDCGISYEGINSNISNDVVEDGSLVESQAIWATIQTMSEEVGQLYEDKYLSDGAREDIEDMIQEIIQQYDKNISEITWMSDITKQAAREKLSSIQVELGAPDQLPKYIKNISIRSMNQGGSLLSNLLEIAEQKTIETYSKLGQTKSTTTWDFPAYIPDAYYDESQNAIFLPAGNFQVPYYDENADYATNLGGVGVTIAHEISHAFDLKGSRYDSKGNQNDWWTKEDREEYFKRTQEVVDYYNSFEFLPGIYINGENTLNENIADLGAISCVSALLTKEEDLQKLFTNYAYCRAEDQESEYVSSEANIANEHAPNAIRANAVLSSSELFYNVFQLEEGDGMYVPPNKRVKVW